MVSPKFKSINQGKITKKKITFHLFTHTLLVPMRDRIASNCKNSIQSLSLDNFSYWKIRWCSWSNIGLSKYCVCDLHCTSFLIMKLRICNNFFMVRVKGSKKLVRLLSSCCYLKREHPKKQDLQIINNIWLYYMMAFVFHHFSFGRRNFDRDPMKDYDVKPNFKVLKTFR